MVRITTRKIIMEIKRFFVEPEDIVDKIITIKGEEFYHLTTVLRHKIGYKIVVCCSDDYDYNATITDIQKDYAIAKIDSRIPNCCKPKTKINLYQAVIKNTKLDIVIQKAIELGVNSITLFFSKNTNETNVNIERLNKIAKEASKQCGRADLVKIKGVLTFEEMLEDIKNYSNIVIPYEYEEKNNFNSIKVEQNGEYALIIGSEGGFDSLEVEKVKELGGHSVTLGNRILRAETASIVATSLLMFKLGEFNK